MLIVTTIVLFSLTSKVYKGSFALPKIPHHHSSLHHQQSTANNHLLLLLLSSIFSSLQDYQSPISYRHPQSQQLSFHHARIYHERCCYRNSHLPGSRQHHLLQQRRSGYTHFVLCRQCRPVRSWSAIHVSALSVLVLAMVSDLRATSNVRGYIRSRDRF